MIAVKLRNLVTASGLCTTAALWTAAMYGKGAVPRQLSKVGLTVVPQLMLFANGRKPLATKREKQLMMAGFGLSALGDISLGTVEAGQVPGFAAFLAAQTVNTVALTERAPFAVRKGPFAAYLAVATAYTAYMWPRIKDPAMKPATAVYALSIALMAAQATVAAQCAPTRQTRKYWSRSAVGGALQFFSDAVLGYNLFVKKLPAGDALVMYPYWLAQLLYASSLAPSKD